MAKRIFTIAFLATTILAVLTPQSAASPKANAENAANRADTDSSPLPPDLPLPASPPLDAAWLREANILQPYGHSAFVALTAIKDRPARLKKEFGFNAIIVQPTDSHNTIAAPADKLTEEQFAAGIAAYRAVGYRIMLYTSLMALGLSPEFQSGQIAREHPDWLQRDPKGNPVLVWGVPWLCPSTGARQAALERCLRLTREYKPDGLMLDNNQFFFAAAGWTCHCAACTKAFRDYLEKRFGDENCLQLFGGEPQKLQVPSDESPLYFEWLHWRNRVWAEINESFRARLRKESPNILLFANTQYSYENGMLATDQQYEREDVVLSESCDLGARQMGPKMVLGRGLAQGRPLWNYIGTFARGDSYTGLRPPEQIGPAIATTLAHHARPWIVDGFDEGPTNTASRALMSKLLSWHASHERLFQGKPYSAVATIISTESRNAKHEPLIPPHVSGLQNAGIPVIAMRDERLTKNDLRPFRVITCETALSMPADSAAALAAWVRAGGTLVADEEVARYDELGRQRPISLLWQALTLDRPPREQRTVGHGTVIAPAALEQTAVQMARPYSFLSEPNEGAEVVAYCTAHSLLLHINSREQTGRTVTLRIPKPFAPKPNAIMHSPDSAKPDTLSFTPTSEDVTIKINTAPLYCVVEVPLGPATVEAAKR